MMKRWLLMCCLLLLMGLFLFSPLLGNDTILLSTDNNIGTEAVLRNSLMNGFGAFWSDGSLLGGVGMFWANFMGLLLTTMPLVPYVNGIHVIEIGLASLGLWMFLRRSNVLASHAATVAWITAFWIGCNFSLVYAGHTAKFGTLAFSALTLWGIKEMARKQSVACAILAGGAMGFALLEQQDVALFFGIFIGAYALFTCVRHSGWRWLEISKLLIPMGVVMALMAGPPALSALRSQTEGVTAGANETPAAKWEFITQWSQPPDETIELLAPGYMGWRSGEPEGPYWGRSGRSAEWEQTRRGFMNFRLEGLYIGGIPIVLALLAWVAAMLIKRNPVMEDEWGAGWKDRRAEILFWGAVAVISLLLAYGKFTPLYWLFYQLPVVNNIRAPVKFIQVFQVALAILSAYGLDFAVTWSKRRNGLTV